MTVETLDAILDSIIDPIVFADSGHAIRYMNKAAKGQHGKNGGAELIGKSIFDCHNERSRQIILEVFEAMKTGEDERLISVNGSSGKKTFMRAVRDRSGNVIGYYERYEKARIPLDKEN